MQDAQSTVFRMKEEVLALCRRKGWGVDGVQNPQHVAVAMRVERLELLEVFGKAREAGREALSPRQLAEAAEEMADVTMYGLQLAYTLNIDLARGISPQASDDITPLAELKRLAGKGRGDCFAQAMLLAADSRFVAEVFQWMCPTEVSALQAGQCPQTQAEIARAFEKLFRRMLQLADTLAIDLSGEVSRKISIVDRRVSLENDPVR